ncbi:MAG: GTPase HflX [Phycisphaeraceae bacterium]|nr:MAG: GTPase HflX [Phycisphaeraceae bacterium]
MTANKERTTIKVQSERAILAAVRLPDSNYDIANPFGELRALAEQAGALVVGEVEQRRERPEAGMFMGRGKVEELLGICDATGATTVIFDHDLSPRQISNIEEVVKRKVIDRSELILDIFASRATTHEAKLQVELAQLEYTYPRLKSMWTHLERQAGGGIGTRGPGEQQLETDRRLVQARKLDLLRELRLIQDRKRREVRRRKSDHVTVGLVGYTNAGKSTLFNTLTTGGAYADDRVFATLVTRTREWDLGGGLAVMLSDTVGFVRDLPHNLIASFRATLEEATHADLLLIVLDASDDAAELQYRTVMSTLEDLFKETAEAEAADGESWSEPAVALLLNKADRLPTNAAVLEWQSRVPGAIAISSLPGADGRMRLGQDALEDIVRRHAQGDVDEVEITLPLSEAKSIHFIENRGHVLDRAYDTSTVTLRARIGRRQLDQLRSSGTRMQVRSGGSA